MRTRSNRTYPNINWYNVPFNFHNLMRQAPASTTTTHQQPSADMSSDSDYTPSPPRTPTPRRRRHRTSVLQSHTPRADLVVRNVAILGVLLAIALLFVHVALYIAIFVVGILAPAWQTYKAIEARDRPIVIELNDQEQTIVSETPEMRNWQAYWVIAAIMVALDGLLVSPFLVRLVPGALYHSLLFTLVTWLTRNRAANAAAIYDCYLKPAFQKSETTIDGAVDSAISYIDGASQQAILAVNQAVAPYARHLEHAAAAASKQMQEQALDRGNRVTPHRATAHRRRHHHR